MVEQLQPTSPAAQVYFEGHRRREVVEISCRRCYVRGSFVFGLALAWALGVCQWTCSIARSADDGPPLSAVFGPKEKLGAWWMPPLPASVQDRMQAVHVVLLPCGKVLIVNGSSNRNRIENGQVRDGIKSLDYAAVNNTCLFDPSAPVSQSGLQRIASPPSPINVVLPGAESAGAKALWNDLFCSGHQHLADGNVLFAGGTQNYYPGEKFLGSRTANLFDWKTGQWRSAGIMMDGHWYPSLVPLADGRVMVISGISWNRFSNSSWVEFYDSSAPAGSEWSARRPDAAG